MRPVLLVSCLVLAVGCSAEDNEPVIDGSNAGYYLNLDPSVKYTGLQSCVECHPVQAATYVESQMGRSFKPATRESSDAEWDDVRPIHDPARDFYYLPFAVGDSLYIKEFRLADGDTVHQRTEKVDYIVGSGQHTNSHMMDVNGYLYQMPSTYYTQDGRWDLPPGFDEGHNWRFERAIELECMTCHNGMPGYYPSSDNRFFELPHGINCERCHGPGEVHVVEKKAGKVVDTSTQIDWTIVNPAKLPRDRQLDVCQRCHLQGIAVPGEGFTFADFRPGMKLSDVIDVYFPRYTDSLSQFIMASHPDRLRMSECRIASKSDPGTMEPLPCITCHNPHVPVEALGRDAYNAPCVGCHGGTVEGDTLIVNTDSVTCTESLEARMALNDDCSTCHMPISTAMDIPHVKITDHNIRIPDGSIHEGNPLRDNPQPAKKEKKFVRLASLTDPLPSHKKLGEGYLAYYEQFNNVQQFLDSAAVQLELARAEEGDSSLARGLIRLWYLQQDYRAIADFALEHDMHLARDAWTLYRIGEAFSNLSLHHEAQQYYRQAVNLGPDHLWFRTKLASAHVALGEPKRAITILNEVLADNPKFLDALNNRGYAYLLTGRYELGERDLQTAVALNPDHKLALANLASLYFNTGDLERSKVLIDRLVLLEPDHEPYLDFQKAVDAALAAGGVQTTSNR